MHVLCKTLRDVYSTTATFGSFEVETPLSHVSVGIAMRLHEAAYRFVCKPSPSFTSLVYPWMIHTWSVFEPVPWEMLHTTRVLQRHAAVAPVARNHHQRKIYALHA